MQAISIYYENICHGGVVSTKKCNLIKNSMPSKNQVNFFKTINDLNDVFKNDLSTSGRIGKKIIRNKNRFNSLEKGFNFYFEKGSRKNAGYLLLSAGDPNKMEFLS